MKNELIAVENGKLIKNGHIIFNGLYLRIYMRETAGILCDDIQTKRSLNEFLLGELELDSGRIFVNEKRISMNDTIRIFPDMTTLIDKTSKLVDRMTLAENIFLFSDSCFFVNKRKYENKFAKLKEQFGFFPQAVQKPPELSIKDRIIIELMRAFIERKKLVILDDLSSYLQEKEVEEILSILHRLHPFGMTFLTRIGFEDDSLQQVDRITAIKSKKTISLFEPDETGLQAFARRLYFNEAAIRLNTKKKLACFSAKSRPGMPPILEFQNVCSPVLRDISFSAKRGELLKIYGSDDQSCAQIIDLLKGTIRPTGGRILYQNGLYRAKGVSSAVHQGICFMEERAYDRMLFQNMTITENLGIPCCEKIKAFWMFKKYQESMEKQLKSQMGKLYSHAQAKNQKTYTLLQVAYYKLLFYHPELIVCINPFADVDIYMRERAIKLIHQYLERGIAVILVTSNYYTANKFEGKTIRISKGKQLESPESLL